MRIRIRVANSESADKIHKVVDERERSASDEDVSPELRRTSRSAGVVCSFICIEDSEDNPKGIDKPGVCFEYDWLEESLERSNLVSAESFKKDMHFDKHFNPANVKAPVQP